MVTNKKGYIAEYYHRERQRIIDELGGKCLRCPETENLEIHHILSLNGNRPNGQLARLVEWRKNMSNLEVYCHDHHCDVHEMERKEDR